MGGYIIITALSVVKQAEQLYDAQIGVFHVCQKATVVQDTHSVVKAVVAVVTHLVCITTMLPKGLCDDVRGDGFVYGHFRDLGTTGFIASLKLGKRTFCSMNFKLILCSYFGTRTHMIGTMGLLTFLFCIERNVLSCVIYLQIVV